MPISDNELLGLRQQREEVLRTTVAGSNVTVSLTATQTAAVSPGNYVYDVEYTQSGGTIVERLAEGIITISAEATK